MSLNLLTYKDKITDKRADYLCNLFPMAVRKIRIEGMGNHLGWLPERSTRSPAAPLALGVDRWEYQVQSWPTDDQAAASAVVGAAALLDRGQHALWYAKPRQAP